MGLKWGAIGNALGEHIENLMGTRLGTWKEYDGNKGKMKKNPAPIKNLKGQKKRHFELHAEYQKYPWASPGYHLSIPVWSSSGIIMSDTQDENRTIGSHLCENWMWESVLKKEQKIIIWELDKIWPLSRVRVSGFSHHPKLVQAIRKKLWTSNLIIFLCRMQQHYWILLIIYGPWVRILEARC